MQAGTDMRDNHKKEAIQKMPKTFSHIKQVSIWDYKITTRQQKKNLNMHVMHHQDAPCTHMLSTTTKYVRDY